MLTVGLLVLLLMWPFFGFLDALVLERFNKSYSHMRQTNRAHLVL